MIWTAKITAALTDTVRDVAPIILVIVVFQALVLRQKLPNWQRSLMGLGLVILGLSFFLVGLEVGLFPLGTLMANQLSSPQLVGGVATEEQAAGFSVAWWRYYWTYLFGFAIGFTATIAEPALIAVAMKAQDVSGKAIHVWGLRIAVATGVGVGVMLGALRIVLGIPLPWMVIGGYLFVMLQTWFAPKMIVPLAYDSGGVATSTVSVPLITALGIGLATQIPNRNPLVDGFGMIALAVLFPMMTVMGYAQVAQWLTVRSQRAITRREPRLATDNAAAVR